MWWSRFLISASCSSRFLWTFFLWSYSSLIWGVDRFDPQSTVLLTDETSILLQELMVSSTNFEFKVDRSLSRSKSLPLLLSLLLLNNFDVNSSLSLFLLMSPYFRNSSSFSKDSIISMLLLSTSFSCLLNFNSCFMNILIYGINLSNSWDFRASMRSSLDYVPVRSFQMLSFYLLEKSELFKVTGSVESKVGVNSVYRLVF